MEAGFRAEDAGSVNPHDAQAGQPGIRRGIPVTVQAPVAQGSEYAHFRSQWGLHHHGRCRRSTMPVEGGDSRRLHQIRPFRGEVDRISITVHAVEVDRGVWDAWF